MCNINAAKFEKRQTDQLKTYLGYTILKIIASKRRNRITLENLEVLLLLGTLKIPVKNPEDYENERKRLEKKK